MQHRDAQFGLRNRLHSWFAAVPRAEASVWIHGSSPQEFEAAGAVLAGLVSGKPQLRPVLTSRSPETVAFLRQWLPEGQAGLLPWGCTSGRYFRRVHPHLIVLLGGGQSFPRGAFLRARQARVPVAVFGHPASQGGGVETVDPHLIFERIDHRPEDVLESLRPLLPPLPDVDVSQAWLKGTLRDTVGQSRLWSSASRWWSTRRIDDWEVLRRRLGRPRVVLCLGNGPSSEDPRLSELGHDCLMRVNWRWRERALLTRPDMVFVGDADTIYKAPRCVFGLWNRSIESAMLLRHLVTRGPGRMEYVTLERLSPLIGGRVWPARPTNGALMIVAAAGLSPERLIISGMDLFRHPQGPYPGETLARNQYARAHSPQVDMAIIDLALRDYPGEVVILSDILRESLAQYREEHGVPA